MHIANVLAIVATVVLALWTIDEAQEHQKHLSSALSSTELLKRIQEEIDAEIEQEPDIPDGLLVFAPSMDGPVDAQCHAEPHSDYDAQKVVRWGADFFLDSAGDCCDACKKSQGCNVWVWCADMRGCGAGRQYRECWLKQATLKLIMDQQGYPSSRVGWIAGALYKDVDKQEVMDQEQKRLNALEDDPELPLVFMEISIKGQIVGRMKIVLFSKTSPMAAENFRQLCTGEKGIVPQGHEGAGNPYHFKGTSFYRIIDKFICQAGINTESVFGGAFKDDPGGLALKHDRKGVLSMANAGPNTNTAHFSIVMAPSPHLDGHYVIFGEVVEGIEVAQKVNALARGKPDNAAGLEEEATISDCGQLRGPEPDEPSILAAHMAAAVGGAKQETGTKKP